MCSFNLEQLFDEVFAEPRPPLSKTSHDFLRQDAGGWAASRKRQLCIALQEADREQFIFVLKEYYALLGAADARLTVVTILGNLVGEHYADWEDGG